MPAELPAFRFELEWGLHTKLRLLDSFEFDTVLDIGAGSGEHARFLRLFGKKLFTVDLHRAADYIGDLTEMDFGRTRDVVWCSHVLEHQRNAGKFLDKIYACLPEGGIVAITVPTHPRARMVSGHISSWKCPGRSRLSHGTRRFTLTERGAKTGNGG